MPTYKNISTGRTVKRTKPDKRLEASKRFTTVQGGPSDQGSDTIGRDGAGGADSGAKGDAQAGKKGS